MNIAIFRHNKLKSLQANQIGQIKNYDYNVVYLKIIKDYLKIMLCI
jgi:hypothetical protein